MGIIARALMRESRALTATEALRRMLHSTVTRSGVAVNEQTALQLMAVYTAVRILSEAFAQVPLKVYRRVAGGTREEARDHPLFKILHDQPNPEMTSFTLREVMMGHLALWGNSYCEISRNFNGEVVGLWPLLPNYTKPMRTKDGELIYETRIDKDPGGRVGDRVLLPARNVLHVPGFGFDGMKGLSVIGTVREGIGLAFAYEAFGSYFFGNNTVPGLTLATDQPMKKEAVDELERRIKEGHEGLTNSQRLMILTSGLKPVQIGMPLDDAQFLEQRKYTRSEIMGLYRVPPHMTNDTEKVSSWGTGIEAMSIGFITYTMMPYFKRFEQVMNMKLFGANAQAPIYPEFDPEGFLRGDFKTRMDGYAIARQWGWASVNDIKARENEPGIGPEGDTYLVPLNMIPAEPLNLEAANVGQLIRAGFEPAAVLAALNLPPIKHLGVPPVTVQAEGDASSVPPQAARARSAHEIRPIGPYPDWDACIADQISKGHDQESAEKICGALESEEEEGSASRALAHRHALADATDRIIRREQADVARGIERLLKRGRLEDVPGWVEEFYHEHRQWAAKQVTPAYIGIAESLGVRDQEKIRALVDGYVERLCSESLDDLKRAIRGEPELLGRILSEWEHRSEKIAEREIGLALTALGSAGARAMGARLAPAHDPILVALTAALAREPVAPSIVLNPVMNIPATTSIVAQFEGMIERSEARLRADREQEEQMKPAEIQAITQGITDAIRAMPAPVVNINEGAFKVDIAPASVNIAPTQVDVATPPVNVTVEAQPPMDVEILRDRNGNPTGFKKKLSQ